MSARRTICAVLLAVMALLAVSCGSAVRRVGVESVDSVAPAGWSGLSATLTVRNDMRRELRLESCRLVFRSDSGELAQADLRGEAAVAARTTSQVRLLFRVTSVSPSVFQYLWRRIVAGRADEVKVDVDAVVQIGSHRRRICARERDLSEIIRTFGVTEQDFLRWDK